jgi:hypothetical protein
MAKTKYQREKSPRKMLIYRLRGEPVSETYPELVPQWLPDSFGPECFGPGSTRPTWWVCENEHYFERPVCTRTKALKNKSPFKGCPYCSGRLALANSGLAKLFPELVCEWDAEENGPAAPVRPGSRRPACWLCAAGHIYACTVLARTMENQSCPQCYVGDRIDLTQLPVDVSIVFNEGVREFDGKTIPVNLGYDPNALPENHKVWWKCKVDLEHGFYRSIAQLRETSFACPQCQREHAPMLADYPNLLAQFHPTRNGKLDPFEIVAGSNKIVWWVCKKHPKDPWPAEVYKRALRGDGCPYCANKRATRDNCLATTHPYIAREWHPTRNGVLTPDKVIATSTKVGWWLCACGTEYSRQICGRLRGSGCPQCKPSKGKSKA